MKIIENKLYVLIFSTNFVDHPPAPSVKVTGRVELSLNFPSGLSWPVLGRPGD